MQISVVKLSNVKESNNTLMLDADYFHPDSILNRLRLSKISIQLTDILLSGSYEILPKSEDYLEKDSNNLDYIKLLRGKYLKGYFFDSDNLVKVPKEYFSEKYSIKKKISL